MSGLPPLTNTSNLIDSAWAKIGAKNIAVLMDQQGTWSLTPAFNVTYRYNHRWYLDRHRTRVRYGTPIPAMGRTCPLPDFVSQAHSAPGSAGILPMY